MRDFYDRPTFSLLIILRFMVHWNCLLNRSVHFAETKWRQIYSIFCMSYILLIKTVIDWICPHIKIIYSMVYAPQCFIKILCLPNNSVKSMFVWTQWLSWNILNKFCICDGDSAFKLPFLIASLVELKKGRCKECVVYRVMRNRDLWFYIIFMKGWE